MDNLITRKSVSQIQTSSFSGTYWKEATRIFKNFGVPELFRGSLVGFCGVILLITADDVVKNLIKDAVSKNLNEEDTEY